MAVLYTLLEAVLGFQATSTLATMLVLVEGRLPTRMLAFKLHQRLVSVASWPCEVMQIAYCRVSYAIQHKVLTKAVVVR